MNMKKIIYFIIVFIFFSVSLGYTGETGKITLEWDPSPEESVIGYNIYKTTVSGQYSKTPINENLIQGVTYDDDINIPLKEDIYYIVTCTNGIFESDKSNEVVLEHISAPINLKLKVFISIENSDVTINNN